VKYKSVYVNVKLINVSNPIIRFVFFLEYIENKKSLYISTLI